uniref:MADF domain-containing protein n=1 Tax=Cacopsylla melanoneura TaxID=428564 RepID=A0A8D8TQ96_9HEMI
MNGESSLTEAERSTLNFIEDYKKHSALWDSNCKLYVNKTARKEALNQLGAKYNLDIHGVKNKIRSLRSYFSREQIKVRKSLGSEVAYESPWFAYKALLFKKDSHSQRHTRKPEETTAVVCEPRIPGGVSN